MVAPTQAISSDLQSGRMLQAIRQWLADFSESVRARDFERGRSLFAPDVVGFGTHATMLVGLDTLVEKQWLQVWNRTQGFKFHFDELHGCVDGDLAWAAVPWESQGIGKDGKTFQRTGRATYILQRRGGCWVAIHSHHSLNPGPFSGDNRTR